MEVENVTLLSLVRMLFTEPVALYRFLHKLGYFNFDRFYTLYFIPATWIGIFFFVVVSLYFFIRSPRNLSDSEEKGFFRRWFHFTFPREDFRKTSLLIDIQWYILSVLNISGGIASFFFFLFSLKKLPLLIERVGLYDFWLSTYLHGFLLSLSPFAQSCVFFIMTILLKDLIDYTFHRLLHECEFLWAFHKIHHYPSQLTPLADGRIHPVDSFLSSTWSSFFTAFFLSLLFHTGPSTATIQTFIGSNQFVLFLLVPLQMKGLFNHTKFPVTLGKHLDRWFVTPIIHIVHHSKVVINKNYGTTFTIWDRMFGTFYRPDSPAEVQKVISHLGVDGMTDDEYKNVGSAIIYPFFDSFKVLIGRNRFFLTPRPS